MQVTVSSAFVALLWLCSARADDAGADAAATCAAEARTLIEGYAATDPQQYSTSGCNATDAASYALCDVAASVGSCASAPACSPNFTVNIGCTPANADTGCCHKHMKKPCPTCDAVADYCVDSCGEFTFLSQVSTYPPDVRSSYCADVGNVILHSIARDDPNSVGWQGCSAVTAHERDYCGVQGVVGGCSDVPGCATAERTTVTPCSASSASPTCCSTILHRGCAVCETGVTRCVQTCNFEDEDFLDLEVSD